MENVYVLNVFIKINYCYKYFHSLKHDVFKCHFRSSLLSQHPKKEKHLSFRTCFFYLFTYLVLLSHFNRSSQIILIFCWGIVFVANRFTFKVNFILKTYLLVTRSAYVTVKSSLLKFTHTLIHIYRRLRIPAYASSVSF